MPALNPAKAPAPSRPAGRILLAQRRKDAHGLIDLVLKKAGFSVDVVKDLPEAVAKVRGATLLGKPYDAVLMDVGMADSEGRPGPAAIQKAGKSLPVIGLVSGGTAKNMAQTASGGFTDFANKPVNRTRLLRTLEKHLSVAPSPPDGETMTVSGKSTRIASDSEALGSLNESIETLKKSLLRGHLFQVQKEAEQLVKHASDLGMAGIAHAAADVARSAESMDPEKVRLRLGVLTSLLKALH